MIKYTPMKTLAAAAGLALFCSFSRPVHAVTISNVTFSDTNIIYETGGIPNGTTIGFTLDSPGLVQIAVNCGIQNFGDTGTNVANLSLTDSGPTATHTNQIFWNGLWLIGGQLGRVNTNCDFALTLSTVAGTSSANPSTLVKLNSVDIHSVSATSSVDINGVGTAPYFISYALAKSANVSITIANSSGTVVRTLVNNASQVPESISTHTITWDGLADSGQPVPLGVYISTITAADPAISNSQAIPRGVTITVQSLAGAAADPQKIFADNAFVYPNPVRNGQALFNVLPVRPGATIHLRIYTITGTLVFDRDITAGPFPYKWTVTNQSGNKLGRGLYYYVLREVDPEGVLQVTKKMAVLP